MSRFLLAVSLILCLGATPLWAASDLDAKLAESTLFYASFDHGFDADIARGEATASQGLAGKTGPGEGVPVTQASQALNLSAAGSWLSYPAAGNIDMTRGTAALWIQPQWKSHNKSFNMLFRVLFSEENRGSQSKGTRDWKTEQFFICKAEGQPTLSLAQLESGRGVKADISTWAPQTWHHVVATWEGKRFTLYVDGQEVGHRSYLAPELEPISIMFGSPWWGHDAECLIDELRILDRPLTADEVAALHQATSTGPLQAAASGPTDELDVFKPMPAPAQASRTTYADVDLPARYAAGPMVVDGALDEASWAEAQEITGFKLRGRDALAEAQTFVRILYDDQNLYFGVRLIEPRIDELRAELNQHDQSVYNDDSFELILNPRGRPDTQYHFVANSIGGIYDARTGDKNWSSYGSVAAGRRGEGQWTFELAIPFKDLGVARPLVGEAWGLRVCRERKPVDENSSVPATAQPFFSGSDLGRLTFLSRSGADEAIQAELLTPHFQWGLNTITVRLRNDSAQATTVKLTAALIGHNGMNLGSEAQQVQVSARSSVEAAVRLPVASDEVDAVSVALLDEKGTQIFGRRLPPAFQPTNPRLSELMQLLPRLQADALALSNTPHAISQSVVKSVALLAEQVAAFHAKVQAAIDGQTTLPSAEWEAMREVLAGFQAWRARYDYRVWQVDPWENGNPGDQPTAASHTFAPLTFELAGNEREARGLALHGLLVEGRLDVRFAVDDFKRVGEPKSFLSRDRIHVYHAPYVRDGFGRLITDPLIEAPGHLLTLTPGRTEKVWVVFDSRGVAPGEYEGTITLKPVDTAAAAQAEWKQIPLRVTVWDFTLPQTKDWPLDTLLFNAGLFASQEIEVLRLFHDYHINWAMTNRFHYMYGMHDDATRINPRPDPSIPLDQYFNPELITSQDEFLREAKRLGMKVLFAWNASRNAEWFDLMVAHLKSLGFGYEEFAFQGMSDEFRAARIPDHMPFHRQMHQRDPDIQFMATLTSVPPPQGATLEQLEEPASYVQLWMHHLPRLWPIDSQRAQENLQWFRERGRTIWTYACAQQMQNWSYNSYYRMAPWRGYLSGIDGIAYWVTLSPKGDGWDHGDGYDEGIVYRGIDKKPVPTKRLEALREGLEDIAYMDILKQALSHARAKNPDADFTEETRLLHDVPFEIERLPQTRQIEVWRHAVAQAILRLHRLER